MSEIKPIQTRYKNYHFRSRLEARWAVFFDALGLKWEYEPEGFDLGNGVLYLPDFRVEYPGRDASEIHYEWFEVKGDLRKISSKEIERIYNFSDHYKITILDGTPRETMFFNIFKYEGTITDFYEDLVAFGNEIETDRCGVALWSSKGRLWYDVYDNCFPDDIIETACAAARSARFEHGQNGAT